MAELNTDVRFVRGVGEARAKSLAKLGITDLKSLISYFPRAYEDRRESRRIAELQVGERACVTAMVASEPKLSRIRKGLELVKLRVVDESAALELTYFNQSYLKNTFHVGESYTFYGTVEGTLLRRTMTNPVFEREGLHDVTGCIVPVYPLTAGVGQSLLHRAIRQGLDEGADRLPDLLPAELRRQHGLCDVRYAYENIHFPADDAALAAARRRLAFEELYFLTLGLRLLRARRTTVKGKTCAAVDMTPFFGALPFSLTGAQARAVDDILRDMTAERPMNRLVQGDVGSGKTMVAAAGIYFAAKNGLQAALMAPTEILAEQHYHTLAPLLEKLGVRCALLTASTKAKTRRSILEQLAAGEIDLAIGTHALLSPDISYQNLGLVVTDEQHRFGVNQRAALGAKGENPHLLVMSATPIPRTLALSVYGDLDTSIIRHRPVPGAGVTTCVLTESSRDLAYGAIREAHEKGQQAYVICPLVEPSDSADELEDVPGIARDDEGRVTVPVPLHDTATELDRLRLALPGLTIERLHGRMRAGEKDRVIDAFKRGEIDVLVSTTVVEVGVDVPNATVMVIENGERFGLAALHQLRGRVGRGGVAGTCLVMTHSKGNGGTSAAQDRLQSLEKTADGFTLAQMDLRLRHEGEILGYRQHGGVTLRFVDLDADEELIEWAHLDAAELLRYASNLDSVATRPLRDAVATRYRHIFKEVSGG